MKLGTVIFLLCAFLIFATGNVYAQWVVVEDFESGLPGWHSVLDDWTGVDPLWRIKTEGSNQTLNHASENNGGLYGMNYVVCRIYPVTGDVTGEVKIRYKGVDEASGYGTTACVVREGSYNATNARDDYIAGSGDFVDWTPLCHSREDEETIPHTIGIWDGSWHESDPVEVDTTGVKSLTVCFVQVAAYGIVYEGWFDDLQFSESLILEVSGVECWEIYK